MLFEDLEINEPIMKALREKGYTNPTPIQAKAIPLVLQKRDVLGCAQTGTGKTAAFAIPIIQLIHESEQQTGGKAKIKSLIVTPTRELAIQIDDNIRMYAKHTAIKHTVIFGGVKQHAQVEKIRRGVHILVATPGRLLDLLSQGIFTLDDIELFVLDEADRMLDMGFINDIKKLLKLLPAQRQSLFFSATMPDNILTLSKTILNNPQKVEVAPVSSTAEKITQYIYYTNRDRKTALLLHLLNDKGIDQALVFTRTKHGADRVTKNLKKQNISAAAIHGDKAQGQRQKALQNFKEGNIKVLVATDIAARGIDIDKLSCVINFEIPNMPETYVHRIGRTGRAGEEGVAYSLCEPEENADVKGIQKLIGKKIETVQDNPFPQTDKPMTAAEKKEWNKEKQRRKQEFFANRKNGRNGSQRPKAERGGQEKKRKPNKQQNNRRQEDKQEDRKSNETSNRRNDERSNDRKNDKPDRKSVV